MDDIYLSVIIPVYNTEKHFKRCIDSVLKAIKKINKKNEIIVINDGSNGNIQEIIKEYLENYRDIIKFISQENRGRGASRNIGLSNSKGKYISFIDSDDYIDEDMYSGKIIIRNDKDKKKYLYDIISIKKLARCHQRLQN